MPSQTVVRDHFKLEIPLRKDFSLLFGMTFLLYKSIDA